MELNQDWRRLQSTLHPASWAPRRAPSGSSAAATLYCLVEQGNVGGIFSEGMDLSEWVGASLADLRAQFPDRVIVEWDRAKMESSLLSSLGDSHLEAQVGRWRADAREQVQVGNTSAPRGRKELARLDRQLVARRNFLIDALNDSWWARVLPSSFGIFLRLEGSGDFDRGGRDFLLVYRKGILEQFGVPDLSYLGADRRRDPAEVVKFLSERCTVPVQGVLLHEEDWNRWSEESGPWREIAWAVQSNRVQLVPFRWSVVSLLASRGLLGL